MRNKQRVILAVIGVIFLWSAEVWAADWKLYYASKTGLSYYDLGSITRSSTNTVKIWTKTVYSAETILDIVAKHGADFKEVNYCITLMELNCEDKKKRNLLENYYSEEGRPLVMFRDLEWEEIIPESIGNVLYREICKQK